ncbi:DUF7537 family lipoprotein [Halorarum salinum]
MARASRRWVLALAIAMAVAPATGSLTAAQGQGDGTEPPGVVDGELDSPSSLLRAHTSALLADGFSANGAVDVTIRRQGVPVDVERTADRTVSVDAASYRQSQRTVAQAPVGSTTREEEFWGNDSVEGRRTVENDRTSYDVRKGKTDGRLSAAALMRPYLRSATYVVSDAGYAGVGRYSGGPVGGERRYTLTATGPGDTTRLVNALPDGASDPRNFEATVVVDEDGRVHEFDASVDYTISGVDRTHTLSFDLRELDVSSVGRPSWVDEALSGAETTGAGR